MKNNYFVQLLLAISPCLSPLIEFRQAVQCQGYTAFYHVLCQSRLANYIVSVLYLIYTTDRIFLPLQSDEIES